MTVVFIYMAFIILVLAIYLIADRIITERNLAINQREWNEYSIRMTQKEKDGVFLEWLEANRIKHGWKYLYIPRE